MGEITGGELFLRSLHAEGVRHVWAIPDGTYMIFLEALERLGPGLGMRLVIPVHEAAGAPRCGRDDPRDGRASGLDGVCRSGRRQPDLRGALHAG